MWPFVKQMKQSWTLEQEIQQKQLSYNLTFKQLGIFL